MKYNNRAINILDLIGQLSEQLGVALEMSFDSSEMIELWPEALDALQDAVTILLDKGLAPPMVVVNVLVTASADHR